MVTMRCEEMEERLADLLDGRAPEPEVTAHLAGCPACAESLEGLQATFASLDAWTAPEPSPFFDTRLYARLREVQQEEKQSAWTRLVARFWSGSDRGLRPAMAGALGLAMLLGGGTAVTVWTHHADHPVAASPTVDDLKIYDNNAQAVQQMDLLDDSDAGETPTT